MYEIESKIGNLKCDWNDCFFKKNVQKQKIENLNMLEMHSKCKGLWITNQTICKICLILKLHFEFDKKYASLTLCKQSLHQGRHPQGVEAGRVKNSLQSANFCLVPQFNSMTF